MEKSLADCFSDPFSALICPQVAANIWRDFLLVHRFQHSVFDLLGLSSKA